MKIIGISVETTNINGKSAQDIGSLWEKFFSENIFNLIPNKISPDILAIYTDYESNYQGKYTTIIGCEVSEIDEIPQNCIAREFPKENFNIFKAKGEMPQAVVEIWAKIWAEDKVLNRKYTYDFERYNQKSQQGINSEVNIHIAVYS